MDAIPFPADDAANEFPVDPALATHPNGDEVSLPIRGRIAVVEDGPETRQYLIYHLQQHGYFVKGIEDGASAIPLLRTYRPDVILLDASLPGIDGFHLCRLIRRDALLRKAVIMMLTGRASQEDRQAGISAGADDYLTKPCEIPEVLTRIATHLRQRETQREQWLNPVTLLPAPAALEEQLRERVQRGDSFGACYADITHFKSYNDRYGYIEGDTLLKAVGDLLRDIVEDIRSETQPAPIAGHLGDDDFLLIVPPERMLTCSAMLADRFGQLAPALYREIDRLRGWVPGYDGQGQDRQFPLISLTIASGLYHPADFGASGNGHFSVDSFCGKIWHELQTKSRMSA